MRLTTALALAMAASTSMSMADTVRVCSPEAISHELSLEAQLDLGGNTINYEQVMDELVAIRTACSMLDVQNDDLGELFATLTMPHTTPDGLPAGEREIARYFRLDDGQIAVIPSI